MAEIRIKDIDEHEIDTILAEDIDFEGHLTFKKPLMIKGKFKGEIKSASSLYIGEKAYVEAKTEAGIVSSKGRHRGDIVGHSRVELFSTAKVDGDITTPDFVMESGCKFNGYCNMSGQARKEAQPHAPAADHAAAPVTHSPAGQAPHVSAPASPSTPAGAGPAGGGPTAGSPSGSQPVGQSPQHAPGQNPQQPKPQNPQGSQGPQR